MSAFRWQNDQGEEDSFPSISSPGQSRQLLW